MSKKFISLSLSLIFLTAALFIGYLNFARRQPTITRYGVITDAGSRGLFAGKRAPQRKNSGWLHLKALAERSAGSFKGNVCLVIRDLGSGREIVLDRDRKIPAASMVKIPIMLSYFYAAGEGKIALDEKVRLYGAQKAPGSGSLKNAAAGQVFSVEELIIRMITESDNTAANILIDRMGFDALNGYFSKMGLKYTVLSRKMMDFRLRKGGVENYTTVAEIAYLLERLYRGRFINEAVSARCLEILAGQKMRDRIPRRLPPGTVVAHKTGLEKGLCHDAGIVYAPGGNFLICVLTRHQYKYAGAAKKLISALSLAAYEYFDKP